MGSWERRDPASDSKFRNLKIGSDWAWQSEITLSPKAIISHVTIPIYTDNNIGHGSFLISNNNYSWSHAYVDNNLKTTTFGFVQGDILRLDVTEKELIYTN